MSLIKKMIHGTQYKNFGNEYYINVLKKKKINLEKEFVYSKLNHSSKSILSSDDVLNELNREKKTRKTASNIEVKRYKLGNEYKIRKINIDINIIKEKLELNKPQGHYNAKLNTLLQHLEIYELKQEIDIFKCLNESLKEKM